MWKLTAAMLLTPVLAMAGNPAQNASAPNGAAESRLKVAAQQIKSDWNQGEFSAMPKAHAAVHPAVSAQTVAMIASY